MGLLPGVLSLSLTELGSCTERAQGLLHDPNIIPFIDIFLPHALEVFRKRRVESQALLMICGKSL